MIHLQIFYKMAAGNTHINMRRFIVLVFLATACGLSPLYDHGSDSLNQQENINHKIDLGSVQIPFYGRNYTGSLWITKDGMISFDERARYQDMNLNKKHILASVDYPFIAPYFFRGEELGSVLHGSFMYDGKIYYRIEDVADSFLNEIGQNISEAVVGISSFSPTWGLIVTWYNVTDTHEAENGCKSKQTCKTNTFQAAIVTDGIKTFAVFNYAKMEVQKLDNHQAGFNAGSGRGWTEALTSDELGRAADLQGSEVRGRYIFMISDEVIIRGGCRQAGGEKVPLQVSPVYAGMFGGEMLEMTGHCLGPNVNVRCLFQVDGQNAGDSTGFRFGSMKIKCPVPRLLGRGRLDLFLSTDGGIVYPSKGIITIVHPGRMNIHRLDVHLKENWNETSPSSLTLTWDASQLTQTTKENVTVNLVGYEESSSKPTWSILRTLGRNIPAKKGMLTFNTADYQCIGGNCEYEVGFVEVTLNNLRMAENHVSLVSRVIPLGWFVNLAMLRNYGSDWPTDKCLAWYNEDKQDMSWLQRLPFCPCNLNQALVDIGRWQPDMGCNIYTGSKCRFHIGAVHCVRSVQPTNLIGAGNQCCYGADGFLRYAADSYQGSTPDRSHDWGAYPYITSGRVPQLSHGLKDVITFYYCCLWTGYKDCDYYMDQRATRDCSGYIPPKSATIYGLGHINTFDGGHFRACLEGDVILLQIDNCYIQGRFQQTKVQTNGNMVNINNTVTLTHIAVQYDTEVAEIRTKSQGSSRRLDVAVNYQLQQFDDQPMYWQDFKNMAIVNNVKPNQINDQSNFTIILHNGIGVQVAEVNGLLDVIVMIPNEMKGRVNGMLGSWDDNADNDYNVTLTSQANNMDNADPTTQTKWAVKPENAAMQNFIILDNSKQEICTRSPAFGSSIFDLRGTCNGDMNCEFDYKSTNSKTIAAGTLASAKWSRIMQNYVVPVRSCGLLDVPKSTKSSTVYTLDSTVTVTGCKEGTLTGSSMTYTCTAVDNVTQTWSPAVSAKCSTEDIDEANVGMIVGIVVAVVVVLFVVIVSFVCVVKKRRQNKGKGDTDKKSGHRGSFEETRYTDIPQREEKTKGSSQEVNV